jgi:hypothetical protein
MLTEAAYDLMSVELAITTIVEVVFLFTRGNMEDALA